nr:acyl-CoA dehydrogenase family protein [Saccharopolyspora sp. HNM0983]
MSDADIAFRDHVREWLRTNVPAEPLASLETAEGFEQHRAWEQRLHAAGLSAVSWPREYGGAEATLLQWVLFEEEYYAAGAPGRVSQNGLFLLAPTLLQNGTDEQRARILPEIAAGTEIWAQAWSEPGAGSDLAGLRSSARRTDGGWLLSGLKTWSSRAAFADRAFGLFRTDPEQQRHRGLSYFMFPLDAPGVTVRPIQRLDGKPAFAELALDEVFVPDADVIGTPGDGWRIAMSTASNERGLTLRSPGRFLATARDLLREPGALDDTPTGERVVDAWIDAQAYRLATFETVTKIAEGGQVGAEASLNKLFWSELDLELHELGLRLQGPLAELTGPDAPAAGRWQDGHLFALAGPIYAGTNEVQRNVAAERLLGLPKGAR